jgi:cytochrome o ubiquinol oxidase subunit 2
MLGGCNWVVMSPSGDIAEQQADLIIISTVLMLIVIVPVMVLIVLFAWRYRHTNKATEAEYDPDWDHSTGLELIIWSVPLLIIICLGAVTWMGTHLLDPYRPLDRITAGKPVEQEVQPLEIQVVALDWKWLFIYPEQGIATVNEIAAPVDRPIRFRITSSSVMNSFYIPALAGMIYAMPGMETKLHAVINAPGEFEGFSANYSGAGFSGMRFTFHGMDQGGFDAWVGKVKAEGGALNRPDYLELERPSENVKPIHYASVDNTLYEAIRNMCVEEGKMCMSEMMEIDAKGGLGLAGIHNVLPLTYDKYARRGAVFGAEPGYVLSICAEDEAPKAAEFTPAPPANMSPIVGSGLQRPASAPFRPFPTTSWAAPARPSNS